MEQKYDGPAPKAELKLSGRRVTRSDVAGDWGLMLRWVVRRDGKEVGTAPARADKTYEYADATPGSYEVVLQTWQYKNYAKDAKGEFTQSKFIDISNTVKYTV
jgi:hypothetical protein